MVAIIYCLTKLEDRLSLSPSQWCSLCSSKFEVFEKSFLFIFPQLNNDLKSQPTWISYPHKNENDNPMSITIPFQFNLFLVSQNYFPPHFLVWSHLKINSCLAVAAILEFHWDVYLWQVGDGCPLDYIL